MVSDRYLPCTVKMQLDTHLLWIYALKNREDIEIVD